MHSHIHTLHRYKTYTHNHYQCTHSHINTHSPINTHMYTLPHILTYTPTYTHTHIHAFTSIHTHSHTHRHSYINAHSHINVHAHTYTHTPCKGSTSCPRLWDSSLWAHLWLVQTRQSSGMALPMSSKDFPDPCSQCQCALLMEW